jgi:hypothetical protein
LKEGYISWADPESGDLMQIKFFGASPQVVNLSQGESMGTASLREFVHTKRTGHPQLSKVASGHKTLQLRATRHAAIQTTAERRAAAYERPAR